MSELESMFGGLQIDMLIVCPDEPVSMPDLTAYQVIIHNWDGKTQQQQLDLYNHMLMYAIFLTNGSQLIPTQTEWLSRTREHIVSSTYITSEYFTEILCVFNVPDFLDYVGYRAHEHDEALFCELYTIYTKWIFDGECKYDDVFRFMKVGEDMDESIRTRMPRVFDANFDIPR